MSLETFEKDYRLRTSIDFKNLIYKRSVIRKKYLSAYFKKSKINSCKTRIGISVSKKVGKANIRNRFKRLIREVFRTSEFKMLGKDINFVVTTRHKIKSEKLFIQMVLEILMDINKYDIK